MQIKPLSLAVAMTFISGASPELCFGLYFRTESGEERILDALEEPGPLSLQHHTNAEEKQRLRFCKLPVGFCLTAPTYFQ